ncbi:MAG: lysoplasmalogenase [Sphingomonadales bacterium]|nr:MAG: lysoplasmalogenase [Sphingomonadales bacterium]
MVRTMKFRAIDLVLLVALIAGGSYYATHWMEVTGWPNAVWKGAGVALLSLWAFARGHPWIGLALAFGALGDVLLETSGLIVGAIAFLFGHVLASGFYWRSHRTGPAIPALIAVAVALASYQLTGDRGVGLYAAFLGLMAGTAIVSRFRLAALGATLFVISDLLIFARLGPMAASPLPGLLIWPTYFAGQALIAWGVVSELAREDIHDRI